MTRRLVGDDARNYLTEAGWTLASENDEGKTTWLDPASVGSKKGVPVVGAQIASPDGGEPTVIMQTFCPPAEWAHTMAEAVSIQKQRDAVKPKEATAPAA